MDTDWMFMRRYVRLFSAFDNVQLSVAIRNPLSVTRGESSRRAHSVHAVPNARARGPEWGPAGCPPARGRRGGHRRAASSSRRWESSLAVPARLLELAPRAPRGTWRTANPQKGRRTLNREALLALADAADALARLARAAVADAPQGPETLVPIREAARAAGTSPRVLRDAIRQGELPAFGRQRDRAVRRADLDQWIGARRVPVREGPSDRDIERRMYRIERLEHAGGRLLGPAAVS
jgi:hypothetical protein